MKMETFLYFSAYILSLTCVCATIHVAYYLNKNTKGAKKVQGQSEAAIIDQKV